MKLTNEAKIGLLATVVLVAVFFGYKYLKNENVFDKTILLYADYDDAQQITLSSPIYFRGVQIGTLKEINFTGENKQKAVLAMQIKQNPGIPKNAKAVLFVNGALGGKALEITFDKPCNGDNCAVKGDHLQSTSLNLFQSFVGTPDDIAPYMKQVSVGVNGMVTDLSDNLKKPDNEVGKSLRDLQATLVSLKQTTTALNQLMSASSSALKGTFKNLEVITRNLSDNNLQIDSVLLNAKILTQNASTIDFSKINTATDGINKNLVALTATLNQAENTFKGFTGTLEKINKGEGTLGKLASNDSVYANLNYTLLHTQALMQDLRLNPKRYINLNPFRRYKQYVVPANDPLLDTLQFRYNSIKKN